MPQESAEGADPGVVAVLSTTTWVQALCSAAMLLVPTLAPQIAGSFGIAAGLVGLQVSLLYGFAMVTSTQAGGMVRRHGACRSSQYAMLLVAAGCGIALLGTPWALAITTVLLGISYGMTNPAAAVLLTRYTPSRYRNVVYSIKQTGVPLGGIIAGLMAPPLAQIWSWEAAFLVIALAALVTTLALQIPRVRWDADRDPTARVRGLGSLTVLFRRREIRWLGLGGFCMAAVQLSLLSFAVAFMVEDLLIGLVLAGIILSFVHAAGVIGRILWGAVADRLGRSIPVLYGLAVSMGLLFVAIAMLSTDSPLWLVVTLLLAAGGTAIAWNGVFLAEVARRSALSEVSESTAAVLVLVYMGVLAGPAMVSGVLALTGSYSTAFMLPAAFAAAALVCLWICTREPGDPTRAG